MYIGVKRTFSVLVTAFRRDSMKIFRDCVERRPRASSASGCTIATKAARRKRVQWGIRQTLGRFDRRSTRWCPPPVMFVG